MLVRMMLSVGWGMYGGLYGGLFECKRVWVRASQGKACDVMWPMDLGRHTCASRGAWQSMTALSRPFPRCPGRPRTRVGLGDRVPCGGGAQTPAFRKACAGREMWGVQGSQARIGAPERCRKVQEGARSQKGTQTGRGLNNTRSEKK